MIENALPNLLRELDSFGRGKFQDLIDRNTAHDFELYLMTVDSICRGEIDTEECLPLVPLPADRCRDATLQRTCSLMISQDRAPIVITLKEGAILRSTPGHRLRSFNRRSSVPTPARRTDRRHGAANT